LLRAPRQHTPELTVTGERDLDIPGELGKRNRHEDLGDVWSRARAAKWQSATPPNRPSSPNRPSPRTPQANDHGSKGRRPRPEALLERQGLSA
jgi:hypothetical protein